MGVISRPGWGCWESLSLQGQVGVEVTGCDSDVGREAKACQQSGVVSSPWTLKYCPCSPDLTLDTLMAFGRELEGRGRSSQPGFPTTHPGKLTAFPSCCMP